MCVCNAIICNKHYVYYKMQNLAVMYYKTPIDWPYSGEVYVGFLLVAVVHYESLKTLGENRHTVALAGSQ